MIAVLAGFGFAQKPGTMTIKLYFHTDEPDNKPGDCFKIALATRKIPKTTAVAKAALEELFKGTTKDEEAKNLWSFTVAEMNGILKSLKVKRGAAYVNFNKVVYQQLGSATTTCGAGFWGTVEKTLKQFPSIKKVFYAIEGNPKDFYDWIQVGECPKELRKCSGKDF